jgi:hypothetical protein
MVFTLPGPVAAGTYSFYEGGFAPTWDADLKTDVLYRHPGSPDVPVVSVEGTLKPPGDAGIMQPLQLTAMGAAIAANCGDQLIVRLTYVKGSSDFYTIDVRVGIP